MTTIDYSTAFNNWTRPVLDNLHVSNMLEWTPSFIVRRFKLFALGESLQKDAGNIDIYDKAVEAMLRVQEDLRDAGLDGHDIPPPIPTLRPCSFDDRVCKILRWQRLSIPCHEKWEKAWDDMSLADDIGEFIANLEVDGILNDIDFIKSIVELEAIFRKMEKIGIPVNKINPPVEGVEWLYAAFLVMES